MRNRLINSALRRSNSSAKENVSLAPIRYDRLPFVLLEVENAILLKKLNLADAFAEIDAEKSTTRVLPSFPSHSFTAPF